jgi:hypothetical protein
MILVLSGEGPTDLGTRRPVETGWEFVSGPMAWMVDRLLNRPDKLDCSILEGQADGYGWVHFLSETDLSALRYRRARFFPHDPLAFGSQFHRASAYQLGRHAQSVGAERNDGVIAVFFRDSDGTNSAPRTLWNSIVESIKSGFLLATFQSGVPMVPRPKSEAWMLCGLFKGRNAQSSCDWLEEAPGNDAGPNSLKASLAQHLGYDPTAEQQAELVSSGQISPDFIDLPSFIAFREELDRAYANAAAPLH